MNCPGKCTGLLLFLLLAISAPAQVLVSDKDLPAATHILDHAPARKSLHCHIEPKWLVPEIDFSLRYIVEVWFSCDAKEVRPGEPILALIRVKPREGEPVVMIEKIDPLDVQTSAYRANADVAMVSTRAAFAVGIGRYRVDVVLTDQRARTCRRQWNFKAGSYNQRQKLPRGLKPGGAAPLFVDPKLPTALSIKPGGVAPLFIEPWNGKLDENGIRLTVLLHAASGTPGAASMHEWEVVTLLESLYTLLAQLPCRSVRLVAFNLDLQTEVFHADALDSKEFSKLSKALEELRTAAVPYQTLEKGTWQKYLLRLASEELSESPDVLLFLGIRSRFDRELPPEMQSTLDGSHVPTFYFRFFGFNPKPDGIQRVTDSMHGTTFPIHDPNDLGRGIKKMLGQIRPDQKKGQPEHSH